MPTLNENAIAAEAGATAKLLIRVNTGPVSWQQLGGDIDGAAAFDTSGSSVSLSADGSTVAIGAPNNAGKSSNSGHVRIYQRNSDGDWQQLGGDIDGEASNNESGTSVSLSADGSTVAIGAPYNNGINGTESGHVRIYQHNSNGDWVKLGADIDGEAANDYSGRRISLSADGNTIAIGATDNDGNGSYSGHVRIYQFNSATNSWEQLGPDIDGEADGDASGWSVSLSADGSTVAIGATYNDGNGDGAGHVRIYQRNLNGEWEQLGSDIDGEAAEDHSGSSVSLSADGSIVAIGGYRNDGNGSDSGHVRIYQRNSNGDWQQLGGDIDGEATDNFSGWSLSLSADGSTVAIGAPSNNGNGSYSGHVRIYQFNSATNSWEQLGPDIDGEADGDASGWSVSLSADGSTVAIGAPDNAGNGTYSGHVRIYEFNEPTEAQQGDILSANLYDALDIDGAIQSTTYQWQSSSDNGISWTDLSGETNQQLDTSTQSLAGKDVRITATTTDALGGSTTFTSAAQTIIDIDDAATARLKVTGGTGARPTSSQQGDILSSNLSDLLDIDDAIQSITYQWQSSSDNGVSWTDLSGETNQQLDTSAQSLAGKHVRVTANTTNVAGGSSTFTTFISTAQTIVDIDVAASGKLTIRGSTGPASWRQLGGDIDGAAAFDTSGSSVSLSADGSTVAIGAPNNAGKSSNSGHVRIYQRNSDGDWQQLGGDIDGEASNNESGTSVSLSADGSTVAIGAPYNNGINGTESGHVRIYQHNSNGDWVKLGADIDGEAANDYSGRRISLSADGNTIAIGATDNDGNGSYSGHVRIYQHNALTNAWEQLGADIDGEADGDASGWSVSLSADGSTVAIGATYNDGNGDGAGHVRIYQRNLNGEWEQLGSDIDGEAAEDHSGSSVSLSADGSIVAIGGYRNDGNGSDSGHVRIYQRNSNGDWQQLGGDIDGEATDNFSGWSLSLSADGSTVAIGAPSNNGNGSYSGHVRIYQFNSATNSWEQLGPDIDGEADGDASGWSVSLSADGSTVAIGAPDNAGNGTYSGHVRIYEFNEPTEAQQGDILSANLYDALDIDGAIQSTTYQWQSSSDNGISWTDLSGETNQQLDTSTQSLAGKDVRITATTTDALGGSTTFTSAAQTIIDIDDAATAKLTIRGSSGPVSWRQLGGDIDGEAAFDSSGNSISLSADGSTIAIGAPYNDGNGEYSGHVRIYQRNSDGDWQQLGGDIDGEATNDESGINVSLSADGTTVAIGAPYNTGNGEYSGHVRIYQRNSNDNWQQLGTDIDGEATGDHSGISVSLSADGSTVAIGAPSNNGNGSYSGHVRIYQHNALTNTWQQLGADIDGEAANDFSGSRLSLSADGSTVAIGATANNGNGSNAGHVRIYQRNSNGEWEQLGSDIDGETADDRSGSSVSLSADGSTLAIGATYNDGNGSDSGHVRIYQRNSNGDWQQIGGDIDGEAAGDFSGKSVSLSADGSTIAIGASSNADAGTYSGHVRIYQLNSATNSWDQLGPDIDGEAAEDSSGWSVSLSADGSTVAIGAHNNKGNGEYSGHVRIYEFNAPTQAQQGDILNANLTDALDVDGAIQSTTYQWQSSSDNGISWTDLNGETNQQLDTSDQSLVSKDVRVTATTTDALGGSTTFTSAIQTIVDVSDAATARLTINGGATAASWQQGDILSANLTDALDVDGAIQSTTYQWQSSSDNGISWTDLSGETNQQLDTSAQSLAGKNVRVTATTTDIDGVSTTFTTFISTAQSIVDVDVAATAWLTIRGSSGPVSWRQLGGDIDGEAAFDSSGNSISLSADGSTIAIGAPYNDGNGEYSGHVRIYQRNSDGDWQQLGGDIDGEATNDESGINVSLSADGSTVAIGAPYNTGNGEYSGHVRIYQRNSDGDWQQLGTDIDGEAAGDHSGISVSLSADGSTVAIGAPSNNGNGSYSGHVRIYQHNASTNTWQQLGADIDGESANDFSGSRLSLSADGSTVAIGATANNGNGSNAGHVRIYQRNSNGEWEQLGSDIDGETADDRSGSSVSLSADGSTLAIGATYNDGNGSDSGHVRIYQRNSNGDWQQIGGDIDGEAAGDFSGKSVSLSADGSTIAIGASSNADAGTYSGHVRIYQLNSATNSWDQLGPDIDGEAAEDSSGWSVSLSADGSTVAIGARNNKGNGTYSGHVRIYEFNAPTQAQQGDILSANLYDALDVDGAIQSTTYQWQSSSDNGISWTDLNGETNQQLDTSAQSLAGKDVRITATTTDALGGSTTFTSTAQTIVDIDDAATGILTINGGATAASWQQGDILSANLIDALDIDGAIQSITYQWQSSSDNGVSWTDLSGETNQQLDTSAQSLAGKHVRVTATTIDTAGGSTTFASTSQTIVDVDDAATARLTISGGAMAASWQQLGDDIDGEAANDFSGWSVSLSADGSTVAIGAPGNEDNGSKTGHVRIYQRNSNDNWQQLGTDIDGQQGDESGFSVSLSADGSTVAIGAPYEAINAQSGSVRIYQRNSDDEWQQLGESFMGEASGDESGFSVSLSADGSTVAIGAPDNDGNGAYSGHVHISQHNPLTNAWELLGADIDGEAQGDKSGTSISLSADGSTLAIGAPDNAGNGTYSGHVRVYQRNSNGDWQQLGRDIDGKAAVDYSGTSISLSADGSTLAIGAIYNTGNGVESGHVRIYQYNLEGDWTQLGADIDGEAAGDFSGKSVSLSADGSILAIGAPDNAGHGARSGHVRIYQRNSDGGWEKLGGDIDGEGQGDGSGTSISLSADGNILAIGAPGNDDNGDNAGHVRIYEFNEPTQAQQGDILSANLTNALDVDGAIQSITYQWQSSSDNGISWTDLRGETNQQLDTTSQSLAGKEIRVKATTIDTAGGSTTFTSVAQTIVTLKITGATGSGPDIWQQLGPDIDGEAAGDSSGWSISLSADGSTIAIGGYGNDGNGSDSGHVRIYQRNSNGDWQQLGADIDGEASNDFSGTSVSLSANGSTVAIGASGNADNGDYSGHVRIYQHNANGDWQQLGGDIDGEAAGDYSGTRISLSADGSTVAIGAYGNQGNGEYSGHVRIYQRNSDGDWAQLGGDLDGEAARDFSGASVSLSANGSTVAIGASDNAGNGNYSGHVRIYQLKSESNTWEQLGGDIDGEAAGDYSGTSVSLSADGSIVAISAPFNSDNGEYSGHTRIYQLDANGEWEQLGGDIDGEAANDFSGRSLSLSADGSTVAIGAYGNDVNGDNAGHVRVYQLNSATNSWEQLGANINGEDAGDWSGLSVSLSSDGSSVAIGAPFNGDNGEGTGHVRIYELSATTQAQQGDILSASLTDVPDVAGGIQAIAYQWQLSSDNGINWTDLSGETNPQLDTSAQSLAGKDVRVTATIIDALGGYITFTSTAQTIVDVDDAATGTLTITSATGYEPASWHQLGGDIDGETAEDSSGWSVSLSADGSTVAIGAPYNNGNGSLSGHVRIYQHNALTNAWEQLGGGIDGEDASDYSGWSVSLSADGSTVAIGAPNNDGDNGYSSGNVRIYQHNDLTNAWEQLGADIDGEASDDRAGNSISLSADGSIVAIGAPYGNGDNDYPSGHVRIYQHNSATNNWQQLGSDIDGEAHDDFSGWSVSLSADGSTVAIGAYGGDGNGSDSGHVRIYQHNSAANAWQQLGDDIDGEAAGDLSGWSLSLSADGSTVAIGASENADNGDYSGHVRIYQRNALTNTWEQLGSDIDGEAAGDRSGSSVSLSADGSTIAIGALGNAGNGSYSGHVRIYQLNSATNGWEQLGPDIDGEAEEDRSGRSVSLSADGSTVAIGAFGNAGNGSNAGHVRIYKLSEPTQAQQGDILDANLTDALDVDGAIQSITYQWQSSSDNGISWTDLSNETNQKLDTSVISLAGKDVRVTATTTDTLGGSTTFISASLQMNADTNAPIFTSGHTAPTIDEDSGADQVIYTATATDETSVSYSLKANNHDDAVSFSIDTSTGEVSLNADPDYETKSVYAFTVIATDVAGNSSEKSISLAVNDLPPQAPSTPDLTSTSDTGSTSSDNITSETKPSFTGTAEAGSRVELFAGETSLGTTISDSNGNWDFTTATTDALPDGSHDITATATTFLSISEFKTTSIPIATPGRTHQEWRNKKAFAVLKNNGSVVSWGIDSYGGDSSSVSEQLSSGVSQLFSTGYAFAALKEDGSVVSWGTSWAGGNSSDVSEEISSGVTQIFSNERAFAALKDNGSVIVWGGSNYGVDTSSVSTQLSSGVRQVYSSYYAFAALKDDGSVVSWGHPDYGADSNISTQISSAVSKIFANGFAFAALKADGSVVSWGVDSYGGDSRSISEQLSSDVVHIVSTDFAFAALKDDGSVVTWGDSGRGANSNSVRDQLATDVAQVFSNEQAFAALKDDGSVVTWGDSDSGGNSSSVSTELSAGVVKVFSTKQAFAALKDDGSVVTWGHSDRGGNSSSVRAELSSGVAQILSTERAFAALKYDGSVVTWGDSDRGGDSNGVSIELSSGVVQIFSTAGAFAALKDDGSVVSWGDSDYGADSSSASNQISSGVVAFADPYHDDRFISAKTIALTSDTSEALNITVDTTAPAFTSGGTATAIDENSGTNKVIYTATATDTSSISYRLKTNNNDNASSFSINNTSGDVTLNIDPDHETQSSYAFTVIATDEAGNSHEQAVSLAVNDLPDNDITERIVSLTPDATSVASGGLIAIPIAIDDATDLQSFDLTVNVDPSLFEAPATVSLAESGGLNGDWTVAANLSSSGSIAISGFNPIPLASGSGSIAVLNLKAKDYAVPGTGSIDLFAASLNKAGIDAEMLDTNVEVTPASFQVFEVSAQPYGLAVRLSSAPDLDAFNLYEGPDGSIDQPDLLLSDADGNPVALSAHWQEDSMELLLLSDEPLSDGDYTLEIDSRADGLISAASGELLDGDGDGEAGNALSTTISVSAPEHSLSIANTARGAGQSLNLNGANTHDPVTGLSLDENKGLPIHLSTTSSLTAFSGLLSYDSSLLINNQLESVLSAGADLPADWTVQIDPSSTPGSLQYSASGSTPITGEGQQILRFNAEVTDDAAPPASGTTGNGLYGSSTLIHASFSSDQITGEAIAIDPGLIALAYAGDTTGDGTLSSLDASRVQRVVVRLDSGFDAYDSINPVLIGDTTGNGTLSSLDASRIQQQVVGLEVNTFPDIPQL